MKVIADISGFRKEIDVYTPMRSIDISLPKPLSLYVGDTDRLPSSKLGMLTVRLYYSHDENKIPVYTPR